MNIAVFADIHANYKGLKAVIDDMNRVQTDAVIMLGDLLFSGDDPQGCFEAVKALRPIVWIRGNTDNWLREIDESFVPQNEKEERILAEFNRVLAIITPEARDTVRNLNEKEQIEIQGKKLLCVHGSDRKINEPIGIMTTNEELEALSVRIDADILLCGHTHTPYAASVNGKLIINAGSAGKPNDEPRACWCLLRFEGNDFGYEFRKVAF